MDPRATRTREQLQQAVLALANERPLDDITIGDIAERAAVNRSSFYQHYSDKEVLLADALEVIIDAAAAPLRRQLQQGGPPAMPPELIGYLEHIAAYAPLYRSVLGEHGSAAVAARLRRRIEQIVGETVTATAATARDDVPVDVVSAGIAGSTLGVITAWVMRDPLPKVETAAHWLESVLLTPARMLTEE